MDEVCQIFLGEIELREPATSAESDSASRFELNGEVVDIESLFLEQAADLAYLAFGGSKVVGAAHEKAVATIVGHDDNVGFVLFIEVEA